MLKRLFGAVVTLGLLVLALVAWVVQPMTGKERFGPPVAIDAHQLEAHVRKLSQGFHPRGYQQPENLDRAAAYIAEQFKQYGLQPTEQTWDVGGKTYRNVVARVGKASPGLVVLGAHYDTEGGKPGADDNGSGVAALLELARVLGAAPPPFSVELVAYSLEEPPFFRKPQMGSAHHADALAKEGVKVKGMFSLETMGYFRDAPGSQHFQPQFLEWLYSDVANYIAIVGKMDQPGFVRLVKRAMKGASELPAHSANAPTALPGIDYSDHLHYWRHGWPAVMITDTAFNRNPNYHEPTDLPDTLDYRRLAMATAGVYSAVYAVGEAP
ncbi:MAG: M28 family peptidase [Myxococcaceae bacterium]|nr:M28 family peptidase [Myxococcaceae bacterium]